MYRLLIVDDEKEIVDWLYELFSEIPDMELEVYKALSGLEALDILGRTKIDVVLSDIKMPGLNGLQLLERIKNSWPLCKVIFLTGYNEFDYVYTAIKYEGVSYLLKIEEDSEVIGEVRKAVAELERSAQNRKLMDKARQYMDQALHAIQRDLFKQFLLDPEAGSNATQEMLDELQLPLRRNRPVYLAACRFGRLSANAATDSGARMAMRLKYKAEELFGSNFVHINLIHQDNIDLVWLLQWRDTVQGREYSDRTYMQLLNAALETLQDFGRDELGMMISFVFCSKSVEWEKIERSYAAISGLLNGNMNTGGESFNELNFTCLFNVQEKNKWEPVDKIKQYIKEHLGEELSLVRLAEMSYFNPSYLSRLFKQVTGQNILDYISDLRIERAKVLLTERGRKISDISTALGFESQHYFSRFFKKHTGFTPQQYKESFIKR